MKRITPFLAAVSALAVFLGAHPPAVSGQGKLRSRSSELNVLLVTIDTLRADRLGCYGYRRAQTPVIDALAASGVRFENVYSHHPVTLPSHASLLTGTHAAYHGVEDNGLFRLPEEAVTVAEKLQEAGLATGAVISAFVLNSQYGLEQGFGTYDDSLSVGRKQDPGGVEEMAANGVSERALAWIQAHAEKRWFLWLHYYDPHGDYSPPPEYLRDGMEPYDGEIAYVDSELGRVLEALEARGLEERTLVVVTADHGESLGEHGELTHGLFLYDATMRVPLIWSLPGALPRGRVVKQRVSLVDVAPSIFSVLGLDLPEQVQGRSLEPLLFADPPEWEEVPVLMETMTPWYYYGWSPSRALVQGHFKLIEAPTPELYDLATDPKELTNVIEEHREVARSMASVAKERLADYGRLSLTGTGAVDLDDESRERLASLGYVLAGGSGRGDHAEAPDVKDRIEVLKAIKLATALRASGRQEEAFSVLEKVLETNPDTRLVLNRLGTWYALKKDFAKGESYFERLIELDPDFVDAYQNLGLLYANASRLDDATRMAETVLAKFPGSAKAYGLLGIVRLKREDYSGALESLDQAIACYPGDHDALTNRAVAHYFLGDLEKALDDLRSAYRIQPGNERDARFIEQLEREMRAR